MYSVVLKLPSFSSFFLDCCNIVSGDLSYVHLFCKADSLSEAYDKVVAYCLEIYEPDIDITIESILRLE